MKRNQVQAYRQFIIVLKLWKNKFLAFRKIINQYFSLVITESIYSGGINQYSFIVVTEPLNVTGIKLCCSVVTTEPSYGIDLSQYVSDYLTEPFYDSRINQYSGINREKNSVFSQFTESPWKLQNWLYFCYLKLVNHTRNS